MPPDRPSRAVALKDIPFIRPGMAALLAGTTLIAALVVGVSLIRSLQENADVMRRNARAVATLHGYNAALEVWRRERDASPPRLLRPEAGAMRDSIRAALTAQLIELRAELSDSIDYALLETVIHGLRASDMGLATAARQAAIRFLRRQDTALLQAADNAQRLVRQAVVLLALAVLGAGILVVPLGRVYLHRRVTRPESEPGLHGARP